LGIAIYSIIQNTLVSAVAVTRQLGHRFIQLEMFSNEEVISPEEEDSFKDEIRTCCNQAAKIQINTKLADFGLPFYNFYS